MTMTFVPKSFNWQHFCLHYESELHQRYQRTPAIAADKIKTLRTLYKELRNAETEPDVIVETIIHFLDSDRGEVAAFCEPELLEDTENLIEGYEWCVNQLPDKSVAPDIRHFCAAQVGSFDEMLQIEEIDI